MLPLDTSPEAARIQVEAFRRMGPEGRALAALRHSDLMRELLAAGVRSRHPGYDNEQVEFAVKRLLLGPELFAKAFPGVEVQP